MIMADFHPIKIKGNWNIGYALDLQVISSEFIGYNEFGHAQFDTKRTTLGELLYKLKYKSDKNVLDDILRIIRRFGKFKSIDVIIPVPPSKTSRLFQPVVEIANRLGNSLGIQVLPNAVRKVKDTPELKNMSTFEEKYGLLQDAFEIGDSSISDKTILLFDDLYQTGATLTTITRILYEKGQVYKVKVLTLTKTKRR
jgi:predicted amidophosphoribosyltransferase